MKILVVDTFDPYHNLALEEYILHTRTDDEYLLLWRNENTIVVGRHQNTLEEINSAFVEEHQVRVVRRSTGGGAVYHDLGNVNFSFITRADNATRITMQLFTRPIVDALAAMGVDAEVSGRNDITSRGRKISGNAQTLHKKRLLHHGTLLFDSDLERVARALTVKPEKFRSKSAKSVRSRIANIRDLLPESMDVDAFMERLLRQLARSLPSEPCVLSPNDLRAVAALREEKYLTWQWNYGRSPKFTLRNTEKYAGGFLETSLEVGRGTIEDCAFFGDFMALRDTGDVAARLKGVRFAPDAVRSALAGLPLEEYFGSITLDEVLACMFAAAPAEPVLRQSCGGPRTG